MMLLSGLSLLTLAFAAFQGAPKDITKEFQVPEGLAVTLWGESPHFYNPTAMDIDARGRIWITEAVNYRKWDGRNPGLNHDAGDRVVILEDTNGDGICDSSKVFVQEKDLVSPLGICVLGNQVLVSCSPNAILYTDENGDDKPDKREIFLTGFGGHDHDHALHSFIPAPDGSLLFNAGNAGPHIVKDKSGWNLRSGSLYNGGGAETVDNKPNLVSDDGKVWTGGLVMKVWPDGKGLQVLAHNFRNNYEVAVDSFGNIYQNDNDDDGNQACRTLWVMEGGNHGYFSADGSRYWNSDHRPLQSVITAHWHQDDPGVVPMGCINGAGGPTGVCMYEGDLLNKWIDGAVLNCDAGANVVYAHKPKMKGAGIELEKTILLGRGSNIKNNKTAEWYRPSDVCVGPDGAVYVADWSDPVVGGHLMYDKEGYGRILRIAPKDSKPSKANIDFSSLPGQIDALKSPALSVRYLASNVMTRGGAAAVSALENLYQNGSSREKARALFLLARMPGELSPTVKRALGDFDIDVRIAAFRALKSSGKINNEILFNILTKENAPALRREASLALRGVPFDQCKDLLLEIASRLDPNDRFDIEALGLACEGKEESAYLAIWQKSTSDPKAWDERLAKIVWRLHPPSAVRALAGRVHNSKLAIESRREALDAIAFIPTKDAADAMLNLALGGPADLRPLAAWWVRHRDTNDWRAYGLGKQIAGKRDLATLKYNSGVVRSGIRDVEIDITNGKSLWLVVTNAGDGNSCDWANWIDPKLHGPPGELSLKNLPTLAASAEWGNVNINKSANGGPLRIAGKTYPSGIGTHAHSEIGFTIPEGYTKFTVQIAPDDGGAAQNGGKTTSIEFQVFVEVPADRSPMLLLQKTVTDKGAAEEARIEAAEKLAADAEGAQLLLKLAADKKLNKKLREAIGGVIYNNPDWSIRALASKEFPRSTATGTPLPAVEELVKMSGDSRRGEKAFFGDRAGCYKCHSFNNRGGDIGPDLTQIRAKYQKPQLLDAVLNPNAAIAFGFDTWMFTLNDGRVIVGFLLSEGEQIVIKDTQGNRHSFPSADVVERDKQKISTMPEGIALGLEPQGVADLLEFLSEDRSAPPKLGDEISLFNGTDMSGWTYHLSNPKLKMEDVWSVRDGVIYCKGEPAGYIRTTQDYTNFVLTLEWSFDPKKSGNSGVLMRMTGEDKVWPKSVEAQLWSRNAGDIWNIDDFPMVVDPARTNGRHTVKMQPCNEKPLGEWNHYEITLNRGELTLVVNGILQNWAHWVEEIPGKICLQSEGAEIRFRNIKLRPILH